MHSLVDLLDSYQLLGPDMLIAHATQATSEDAMKLTQAGAHISSTPETELQMALGEPTCFRTDLRDISSLGVDCHTTNSASIMGQMRLALQNARGTINQRLIELGKFPNTISPTVEEVFNLGTIKGARSVRMESDIGSLAIGKRADVIIFNGMSPAMVCAAQHSPVSAIVLHASSRDIEGVIIDGRICKTNGALVDITIDREISKSGHNEMSWEEIANELLKSRERVQERIDKTDFSTTREEVLTAFQIERSALSN
jgi:cytosine/adenosine deaminase-related metal-dependent hydrolase